jgi:hypothetical protein
LSVQKQEAVRAPIPMDQLAVAMDPRRLQKPVIIDQGHGREAGFAARSG